MPGKIRVEYVVIMKKPLSRRAFLQRSTFAGGSLLLLPSSKLAFAAQANDKLNLAGIGVAGRGGHNLNELGNPGPNLVALRDVDEGGTWMGGGNLSPA